MVLMIRQLYDNKVGKPLTLEDIPEGKPKPEPVAQLEHTDPNFNNHRFKLYRHPEGVHPFKSDYVKTRTHVKKKEVSKEDDEPFTMYYMDNGERFVDRPRVAYELWKRWGEGCFDVYWFGGKTRIDNVIRRTWIKKLD